MASNTNFKIFSCIVLALALCVHSSMGHEEVKCEKLNEDTCAFAVSATGKRCVLEKGVRRSGFEAYTCRASEIEADKVQNIIESDHCVKACGLDRKSLGISSDSLLEPRFTQKLCSPQCYHKCPNVVDLYFNLAAGEGVFLPKLCEAQQENSRREMSEIRSSGMVNEPLGPVQPIGLISLAPEPTEPVTLLKPVYDAAAPQPEAPAPFPLYF